MDMDIHWTDVVGLLFGVVLVMWGILGCKKEEPVVEWVGSPMVSQGGVKGYVENIEYGFRGDGVMVWRVKGAEK
jgi:hypothetical protein